jgi:hypothetical protein
MEIPAMPSLSVPSPIGQLAIDEKDGAIVAIRWSNEPAATAAPCSPKRRGSSPRISTAP